MYSEGNSFRA